MLCIKQNSVYEQIINKSRFITLLYKIDSIEEANEYISDAKLKYPDATHCTYAYILDGVSRMSDDGEPSKTAGSPILNVLNMKDLNHILCIVVRYFGGIKLGAGGLVRAYSSSCSKAIDQNEIIELVEGFSIRIIVSYDELEKINYILTNSKITYKEFNDVVTIEANVTKDVLLLLKPYKVDILSNILING
jgi:uncharacterized YigZ family protein